MARFWLMMVLAATGLLAVLSAMTDDPVSLRQLTETAELPPSPIADATEDKAGRRAAERRQRRVSISAGYQIETGAVFAGAVGTADLADAASPEQVVHVRVPVAPAAELVAKRLSAVAASLEQTSPQHDNSPEPSPALRLGAGPSAEPHVVVAGRLRRAARKPLVRVNGKGLKAVRMPAQVLRRAKRPISRQVAGGEPLWVGAWRDGS